MAKYERTFCSTCGIYRIHENGSCMIHAKVYNDEVISVKSNDFSRITERKDGDFIVELPIESEWLHDEKGFTTFMRITEDQLEQLSFELKTYILDKTIKRLGEPS